MFRHAEALVTESKLAIPAMQETFDDPNASILLLPVDEYSSKPELLALWEHFGLKVQKPSQVETWFAELSAMFQEKASSHN